jgi:hypothetical protein
MFGAGSVEPSSLDAESKDMLSTAAKEEPKWELDFSKIFRDVSESDSSPSRPEPRQPGETPLNRFEKVLLEQPMDTSETDAPSASSLTVPDSQGAILSRHLGKATISTPPSPKAGVETGKGDSSPPPQQNHLSRLLH